MRKLALLAVLALAGMVQNVSAYTWRDAYEDLAADTERTAGAVNTGYFYDLQEEGDARNKLGISITLLTYKFISFDPAWIYTPDKANSKGEAAFSFPIHIGEIPLPGGGNVREAFEKRYGKTTKSDTIFDSLYVGPYFFHNFFTEKFGYGGMAGLKLF